MSCEVFLAKCNLIKYSVDSLKNYNKDDPTRDLNHGRDSPQIYQSQIREATCEKFEKNNNDGKACTNQMKTGSCDIDLHPSAKRIRSNVPAASRTHPRPTSDVSACDGFI